MTGQRGGHPRNDSEVRTAFERTIACEKRAWRTRSAAKAATRNNSAGLKLRVYRCTVCGLYHHTSQPKRTP